MISNTPTALISAFMTVWASLITLCPSDEGHAPDIHFIAEFCESHPCERQAQTHSCEQHECRHDDCTDQSISNKYLSGHHDPLVLAFVPKRVTPDEPAGLQYRAVRVIQYLTPLVVPLQRTAVLRI